MSKHNEPASRSQERRLKVQGALVEEQASRQQREATLANGFRSDLQNKPLPPNPAEQEVERLRAQLADAGNQIEILQDRLHELHSTSLATMMVERDEWKLRALKVEKSARSSARSERLPDKQEAAGSNPAEPTNAKQFDKDTSFVVLSAIRYGLCRASYAVGLIADWTLLHWDRLSPETRRVIRRDVGEALDPKRAAFRGHDMDRRTWERFLTKTCRCRGTKQVPDGHGDVEPCPDCKE